MDKSLTKSRLRRILFWSGIGFLIISTLPWLGFGGYSFIVPSYSTLLPRLRVIDFYDRPLYDLLALPVGFVGLISGMDRYILFREGIVTPFALFVFYFVLGSVSICVAGIPRISLRSYLCSVGVIGVAFGGLMAIDRARYNADRASVRQEVFARTCPLYDHLREYFTEAELQELDRTHHAP